MPFTVYEHTRKNSENFNSIEPLLLSIPLKEEHLDIRYIDGINYELLVSFSYKPPVDIIDKEISVPVGFVTDFASIPKILWPVLPPTGPYGKAAVLHDWCYRTGMVSRLTSDNILYHAALELGTPTFKAWLIYEGVRIGGSSSYCDYNSIKARRNRSIWLQQPPD